MEHTRRCRPVMEVTLFRNTMPNPPWPSGTSVCPPRPNDEALSSTLFSRANSDAFKELDICRFAADASADCTACRLPAGTSMKDVEPGVFMPQKLSGMESTVVDRSTAATVLAPLVCSTATDSSGWDS